MQLYFTLVEHEMLLTKGMCILMQRYHLQKLEQEDLAPALGLVFYGDHHC